MKWTEEYVRRQFPARVRELRQQEGLRPDEKPTHEWINNHGFSGIQGYASRVGKTVDEVLLEECEFDERSCKPLPGHHAETKRLVNEWLEKEDESFQRWDDTTVTDARTHIRKLLEISMEQLGSDNLLRPARASKQEGVQLVEKLFTGLNEHLESSGARYNYGTSLSSFYRYLVTYDEADHNPAEVLLPRMGWKYERQSPAYELTPSQVRNCWEATESLQEKVLLLMLAAAGLRPDDTTIPDARDDVVLERGRAHIRLEKARKNGPGKVALMAGREYVDVYLEELAQRDDWNGKLFPSEQSASGARTTAWIRSQVDQIVTRADVTFPDGSKPTPKHFRAFWYNEFVAARQAFMSQVQWVADEQGSSSAKIAEQHYLNDHASREHFRRFAQSRFEAAFPTDIVTSPSEFRKRRKAAQDDDQTTLDSWTGVTGPISLGVIVGTLGVSALGTGLRRSVDRLYRHLADDPDDPGLTWWRGVRLSMGMMILGLLMLVETRLLTAIQNESIAALVTVVLLTICTLGYRIHVSEFPKEGSGAASAHPPASIQALLESNAW